MSNQINPAATEEEFLLGIAEQLSVMNMSNPSPSVVYSVTVRIQEVIHKRLRLAASSKTLAASPGSPVEPEKVEISWDNGKIWDTHETAQSAHNASEDFSGDCVFRGLYPGPNATSAFTLQPPAQRT